MKNLRVLFFLILFLIFVTNLSQTEIYDYTAIPGEGDTFETAKFRINVPDSVDVVRGIYFGIFGKMLDSREIATYEGINGFCAAHQFAVMGALLDDMDMESGMGNAVLGALDTFAVMSGRPELHHSCIYFEGNSWGGQFAYHFTKWEPERVIAFITKKGGFHDTTFAGNAMYVPGYMFIAEYDSLYRIENLTGIFEEHRPFGAKWILAMQPNAWHETLIDRSVLDNFFLTMEELRLPEEINPDEPMELVELEEIDAWLGDRESQWIGDYPCYTEDPWQASWFATKQIAIDWQNVVSDSTISDTFPCDPTGIAELKIATPSNFLLEQNYPNPFNPTTTIFFTIPQDGAHLQGGLHLTLDIYDVSGKLIKTLIDGKVEPGYHSVVWNGKDNSGQNVPSGVYFYQIKTEDFTKTRQCLLLK